MLFDLHSHTTASDGKLTPSELVLRAVDRRIDVLAITDHDNVAGLAAAKQAIAAQQLALHLINGIEISTLWQNKDIHIVGLNIDPYHPAIESIVQSQAERRAVRAKLISERLAKHNVLGAYEGAAALAQGAPITRSHFAHWLVAQGHAKNLQAVFKQFLTRGNQGYVPPNWCSMAEAIDAIHQAGGHAVLAHPGRYKLTAKWLKRLLADFVAAKGDGLEVAQPQQAFHERRQLADYAQTYGLLTSQGSDFHYATPWLDLGKNLYLPKDCQPIWRDWQGLPSASLHAQQESL